MKLRFYEVPIGPTRKETKGYIFVWARSEKRAEKIASALLIEQNSNYRIIAVRDNTGMVHHGPAPKNESISAMTLSGTNPAKRKIHFSDLSSMIRSREYDSFIADKLGNDLFISDPERADRIFKYAEDGANGSTPFEEISDWREFLDSIRDISDRLQRKITMEIDDTERYWINRGDGDTPHG